VSLTFTPYFFLSSIIGIHSLFFSLKNPWHELNVTNPHHFRAKDVVFGFSGNTRIQKVSKYFLEVGYIASQEICVPLPLVSSAPDEQDALLTLGLFGEFK